MCVSVIHRVWIAASADIAGLLDLMSMLEKPRFRSFLQFVHEYNGDDSQTWDGFDASTQTMKECYEKFGLETSTEDFTGHALALYLNDE